jgi:hypothetical protein
VNDCENWSASTATRIPAAATRGGLDITESDLGGDLLGLPERVDRPRRAGNGQDPRLSQTRAAALSPIWRIWSDSVR